MKGYALSSAVAAVNMTAEAAEAFTKGLRRLEAWWANYLTGKVLWVNADGSAVNLGERWESLANVAVVWSPDMGAIPEDIEMSVVQLVETLPPGTPPDDVAYHTVDEWGRPVCLVSWEMARDAWPEAMMHEILESRVDAPCTSTVKNADGLIEPLEVCDRLQNTPYWEPGSPGFALANAYGPQGFVIGATRAAGLDIASDLRAPTVTASFGQTSTGYHETEGPAGERAMNYGPDVSEADRARLDRTGPRGGQVREARRIAPERAE